MNIFLLFFWSESPSLSEHKLIWINIKLDYTVMKFSIHSF